MAAIHLHELEQLDFGSVATLLGLDEVAVTAVCRRRSDVLRVAISETVAQGIEAQWTDIDGDAVTRECQQLNACFCFQYTFYHLGLSTQDKLSIVNFSALARDCRMVKWHVFLALRDKLSSRFSFCPKKLLNRRSGHVQKLEIVIL